jgi:hypothetical protein
MAKRTDQPAAELSQAGNPLEGMDLTPTNVIMLQSMSGVEGSWKPGDIREVPAYIADAWESAGIAKKE